MSAYRYFLGSLLMGGVLLAAPPIDLAGEAAKSSSAFKRPLTQDDLVYTENVKTEEEKLVKEAGKVLFQVVGRSLPGREGRALHTFRKEDFVKILKSSKDGHWLAIETIHPVKGLKKVKAWVPKNAIQEPSPVTTQEGDPKEATEGANSEASLPNF